ncbi:hypothetical protein [Bacterioplanoides sp.]|uniref:hypothetical protein n=2 Tax=Bacterioplanoides sp. TaxID=2066072 RepID=UPI003B0078F0
MTDVRKLVMTVLLLGLSPMLLADNLSEKRIQQWLTAMPSLTSWLHQHQEALHSEHIMEESSDMEQVFAKSIELLRAKGLYDEFNQLTRKQGYQNVEQWSAASRDISLAYMALQMEQEQITVVQLEEQLAKLEQAPVPAEQKAMMTEMMQTSLMMLMSTQGVSDQDKQLVRQYASQIETQFNAQNDDDGSSQADHGSYSDHDH